MFPRPDEWRLKQQFDRFHRENPHVYVQLRVLAYRWRERHPRAKCGIGMLYEVARWTLAFETQGEPLKLNNNYHAFYARLLMEQEEALDGIFEIREQRA